MEIQKSKEKVTSKIRKYVRRNSSGLLRKVPFLASMLRLVLDQKTLLEVYPTIPEEVIHTPDILLTRRTVTQGGDMLPQQIYPVPEDTVLSLTNVFYYIQRRKIGVVTSDRILLSDLSYSNDKGENHPVFLKSYLPKAFEVDGTVAVVAGPGGGDFYHYFSEVLYMYYLYEQTDIAVDYYITHTDKPFQKSMLALLKIPAEKILSVSAHPAIHAKRLVLSNVAHRAPFRKEYINFIRKQLDLPLNEQGTERIYISRNQRGRRTVINEAEIFSYLKTEGFEKYTLENMGLKEQIELFSQAEYIIAPHGAGLLHLLFVQENTRVLELFHESYKNQCFRMLAQQVGAQYDFLVDRTTEATPNLMGVQNMRISLEEIRGIVSTV